MFKFASLGEENQFHSSAVPPHPSGANRPEIRDESSHSREFCQVMPGLTRPSRDSAGQLASRVDTVGGLEESRLFPDGSRLTRSQDRTIIEPDSPYGKRTRPGMTSRAGWTTPGIVRGWTRSFGTIGAASAARAAAPAQGFVCPGNVRPGRSALALQRLFGRTVTRQPAADPLSTGGRRRPPAEAPSNSRWLQRAPSTLMGDSRRARRLESQGNTCPAMRVTPGRERPPSVEEQDLLG